MSLYTKLIHSEQFFVIAGPCVIEDESTMLNTAEYLKQLCGRLELPLIFKSSYKKANRSSGNSYLTFRMDVHRERTSNAYLRHIANRRLRISPNWC